MDENLRVADTLQPNFDDGDTFLHTDVNKIIEVFKTAINSNYSDINKILEGTSAAENSNKLGGNTLSKSSVEILQDSDDKVPSSKQVKDYVDASTSSLTDLITPASELASCISVVSGGENESDAISIETTGVCILNGWFNFKRDTDSELSPYNLDNVLAICGETSCLLFEPSGNFMNIVATVVS